MFSMYVMFIFFFFFSSRRRHTRLQGDWSSDVCSSDLAGGALLKHVCEQQLHCDVKPGDRLFYFTTLGWMMWNWVASALASGATLLLYDGSPFVEKGNILFDYADAEGMTHLGTSAKFIDALSKAGMEPAKTHRLEHLRAVLSTGSPLVPEGFDYVYRAIKRDVCLSSISGGTDICGCFVLGNPILPVRSEEHTSELQSPCNLVCRLLLEKKKKHLSRSPCSPAPPITH